MSARDWAGLGARAHRVTLAPRRVSVVREPDALTQMLRAPPSPDPKVTVEFIDRQLARDNLYVQFKLGRMLLRGELFPANPRLGFAVSRVAAERGYGPACLMLAVDFYGGRHGLPKRHDLWAHYWSQWKARSKRVRRLGAVPAVVVPFPGRLPNRGA